MDQKQTNVFTVPAAIVVAGIIIAGAIIWTKPQSAKPVLGENEEKKVALDPINKEDHILGNPDAPVKIIEYSDFECPYCKQFHPTMKQIVSEYTQQDGKVAWVYRHFPLDQIHTKARKEAEASECAAEIGGNAKFWQYTDRLFTITPANDRLDLAQLPKIAKEIGLDETAFNECLNSGKMAAKVEKHYQSGLKAGVDGTPHSVVIGPKGTMVPMNGAYPHASVKQIIESLLQE